MTFDNIKASQNLILLGIQIFTIFVLMEDEKKEHKIPNWLKDIQENSWELELLISGGAIFTLFHLSDILLDFTYSLSITSKIPGTRLYLIFGMMAIQFLKLGFIVHLMLRAFWLSLVCINYVFPGGINKAKIKWKPPFRVSIDQGDDLKNPIVKVDRACGTVMFLTIISTIVLFGLLIGILVFFTIPGLLIPAATGFFLTFYTIAIVLYMLDLLSFGGLRRIKYLSYITYPFLRLLDILTLRSYYQEALWMYNSNISRWKFSLGMSVFTFVAIFFTYITIYQIQHWPNIVDQREFRWQMAPEDQWLPESAYRNLVDEDFIFRRPNIQSDIITDGFIQLEIPYNIQFDEDIRELPEGQQLLSNTLYVKIDDSTYSDIYWMNKWSQDNDKICVRANIGIQHLDYGQHFLEIGNARDSGKIPFWKN